MRAYHFLPAKYAVDDIVNRRIKISRIADLNDPFELLSVSLPDRAARCAFLQTKRDLDAHRGVICFSKNWHNPVLWSHYADKHRGICLGFKIDDALAIHIKYDAKRLVHDLHGSFQAGTLDEAIMLRVLQTKFEDWKYEDEVRVFANLEEQDSATSLYFKDFDSQLALREIIFGARCEETAEFIQTISGSIGKGIRLVQGRLAFRSFKVVEDRRRTKAMPNQCSNRTLGSAG
jgi:hypothetical protein